MFSSTERRRPSGPAFRRPTRRSRRRALRIESLEDRTTPATFTVATTADAGPGSLRQAILDANATPDPDDIAFDIPGTGVQTIALASALPPTNGPLLIDGFTQPGASPNTMSDGDNAVRLIELDGTNAGPSAGLILAGGFATVRGLTINHFAGDGIDIASGDNTVEGNSVRGNGGNGVAVLSADPGGPAVIYRNDFEGSVGPEWSSAATDVTPSGVRHFLGQFGSDTVTLTIPAADIPAGTTALTMSFDLFVIRTWDGNDTGSGSGPDRWSLTLGNGVNLLDTTFSNNVPTTAPAGQAYPGVYGTDTFNPQTGAVELNSLGYTFGASPMDSVYRPHFTFSYTGGDLVLRFTGALTTPGTDESWGLDNVEVRASAAAASVAHDFSVTNNPTGAWTYGWSPPAGDPQTVYPVGQVLTGGFNGAEYWYDPNHVSLGTPSVLYNPTANTIGQGSNLVAGGQVAFHPGSAGEHSVVRWTAPASGDYAVAALFTGDDATSTDVHVWHNGGSIFDGLVNGFRSGPYFETTETVAAGDTIDFRVGPNGNYFSDSTGLDAVVTPLAGPPTDNTIGGPPSAARNVISSNAGAGVRVAAGTAAVVGNAISGNGGLGIDLVGGTEDANGVTANDPDGTGAGPNGLQNFPVLTGAITGDGTQVTGTLDSAPNARYRLEFFAGPAADASGYGEGSRPIGTESVTADASGHAAFLADLASTSAGEFVTATASLLNGDQVPVATSEFSAAIVVVSPVSPTIELSAAQYEVSEGDSFAVLTVRRTGPLTGSAHVDFATVPGTATEPVILAGQKGAVDYTTTNGTLSFRPRMATATIRVPIRDDTVVEPDESFRVVLSNPSAGMTLGDNAAADVVIHDNDPSLSFAAASSERKEGMPGRDRIEVRLNAKSNKSVTVAYSAVSGTATTGLDFTPGSGTLTFRPGETRKFIDLTVLDDARHEGDETATLELSSPTNAFLGAQVRHRVKIVDDDPEPPPQEPGSTPATALAIDLQTLPRQTVHEVLSRLDIDTYRVHLGAGEFVTVDVDPELGSAGGNVRIAPLASSTLVVTAADGSMAPIVVGRSPEPETGALTNNPAYRFRAPAAGDYLFELQTLAGGLGAYGIQFHRVGVSERVPDPALLNVAGPMFAWFDGSDTVGVTGPTGYGFTLTGAWHQQVTFNRRTGLRSQTLTLPAGAQFNLDSPQGVSLPLLANGPITIETKPNLWGNLIGEVKDPVIDFPVSLAIAPINDLLAAVFHSQFAAVGLLSGDWRISLGGSVLAVNGRDKSAPIDQLLAGVPYLRQKGPINAVAQLGSYGLDYSLVEKPIDWVFDPGDPMLYVKADEVQNVKEPALALSLHGLLEYNPLNPPSPGIDAGVTHFYGQVYATAKIPFKVAGVPLQLDASEVFNIDANRDGRILGDLRDADELFDVFDGNFSEVREVLDDVQFGVNGKITITLEDYGFEIEGARASVVYNGPAEAVWVRAQEGNDNFLAGTPLAKLDTGGTSVVEGMVNADGDFFLSLRTHAERTGISQDYDLTITNQGITAHVVGRLQWSVDVDLGFTTVSGKAIAQVEGDVAIDIEDGEVFLSGSVSATGKLVAGGHTVFSGSVGASVRSKGLRFEFPKGVGELTVDLFD
jgi:hypothetical protein